MFKTKYEQPSLTTVTVESTDILLTSAGGEEEVLRGGLGEGYTGAQGEITWDDVRAE